MAIFRYIALLAFFVIAVASAADFEEEDDVIVLKDSNFESVVTSNEILLVEFYAPWCGHCKSLAPEYAKAAKALKENDPPIRIAKLDATAETKSGESFKVQGFPTLKLFRGSVDPSTVSDYDGGRTADEIIKWMSKKSGPAVKVVETQDDLDKLTKANDVVVVALVSDVDGEERKELEKVASKDDNAVYVVTTDSGIASKLGKTAPAVVLLKNFDELKNEHDGEFKEADIAKFVKANDKPLVMTFSQEKAPQIFGGDINVHVLMFTDSSKDYHEKMMTAAKVSATENKGKLLHINVPLSEDRILDYFGFKEADLPALVLVNMESGMKKFGFEKKSEDLIATFDTTFKDDLLKFENDYFSGNMKPTLKSAEPVDDADDAVKTLVGKSFQERVLDSGKDVLVEFYAPWCGHCKNLAPKYDELAEKFASVDSIVIAKMDSTENEIDVPGVDVQGFPTLIFFPAKAGSKPITFDGARDVDGMTKFLKENAGKFDLDGESHGKSHDEL